MLEQVLRATLCTDSIRFVCRLFTQVLQSSSVSGTFVLQFIKKRKGLRVSGSEYKQGFLKFLYNAMEGVRKCMCKF